MTLQKPQPTPGAVLRALRAHYGSTEAVRTAVNAEARAGQERWIVAAYRLAERLDLDVAEHEIHGA